MAKVKTCKNCAFSKRINKREYVCIWENENMPVTGHYTCEEFIYKADEGQKDECQD